MNQKSTRILIVALLLVASVFCWAVYAQKNGSAKTMWEYSVVTSATGDNPTRLTELGKDGWELTSVRTEDQMVGNFRHTTIYYYLKRPKQVAQ